MDSSHLAGLALDWASPVRSRQEAARSFVPRLIERGWVLLLSWHQVQELMQHRDDSLVDERLRFIQSWPLLAWIRSKEAGPGSVFDAWRMEVCAAYDFPDADVHGVRELTRPRIFSFGSGADALPDIFKDWRHLREALNAQQENARRVAAISKWRAANVDHVRIKDLEQASFRAPGDVGRALLHQRQALAREIATRGDKRIADPDALAGQFIAEIASQVPLQGPWSHIVPPVIQLLLSAGHEPEDIDRDATFGEMQDLLVFHQRLRMVADADALPWRALKRTARRNRLPITVIEDGMRVHGHDQPERKGSDLNDVHLLCLAPYADVTYVDKRTLESVRRVRAKVPDCDMLLGEVRRAANYGEIYKALTSAPDAL
ncbi:hypothetical protein C4F17_09185 [Variovorax sp. PMC12]|nr:hypothetical protein C4F17_09185 [Variovorax sp. PMC12]